jgi:hypothetical protein
MFKDFGTVFGKKCSPKKESVRAIWHAVLLGLDMKLFP